MNHVMAFVLRLTVGAIRMRNQELLQTRNFLAGAWSAEADLRFVADGLDGSRGR